MRVRVLFHGPGPQANGLSAAPEGLWICDQKNHKIYLAAYDDGRALASFDTPARNLSGIGYGIDGVWGASNVRPSAVYRFDPWTGHCTHHVPLPSGEQGGVHGIEIIDGALWVTRPGMLSIQQLDPLTGALQHEIPFPGRRSHGIYWADGAIVCNDTNLCTIFRLDPKDGKVLDEWKVDGFTPHGLTRDAHGHIWTCDAETNEIGVVEP
jgi:streptogramin lyase